MNFTINRDLLLENLTNVSRALSTKTPMPVLTGIKFEITKSKMFLTASNNEISIQAQINEGNKLKLEGEGSFVVPGKILIEIIRKLDANEVQFKAVEDNIIKIYANRSDFTLNALERDNFPLISFAESKSFIKLDIGTLKQIIRKTTFATSLSESRAILTGVCLNLSNSKLEAISTDSFRLAKIYLNVNEELPEVSVVIPSKSLDELNKVIIDDNESDIELHFSPTKILFKYKNLLFQSRLIDGVYPNTSSLIPTEFLTSIKFNKAELVKTIDLMSLFTNIESSNIIQLQLNPDKTVEIKSTTSEIGEGKEELIPLECSNPVSFKIAFSAKYFLEAVRSFDSSEIVVHFTGEIKPFIVTGEYDVNLTQLILPVRVS